MELLMYNRGGHRFAIKFPNHATPFWTAAVFCRFPIDADDLHRFTTTGNLTANVSRTFNSIPICVFKLGVR
jgi:hypothetical protein